MAKGAYYGSGGKAKEITSIYAGVLTDVPVYEEKTYPWNDNTLNFLKYFDFGERETAYNSDDTWSITTDTFLLYGYCFSPQRLTGRTSCYFETAWKALVDMTIQCAYLSITEKTYDKVTIKIGSNTVVSEASGNHSSITKTNSYQIKKGDTVRCIYYKDASNDADNEKVEFYINVLSPTSITVKEQAGSEKKKLAQKVSKGYIGINKLAKLFFPNNILFYTGAYTTQMVTKDNIKYTLYTLTSSGDLSLSTSAAISIWLCGGGADGGSSSNFTSYPAGSWTHYTSAGGGWRRIFFRNIFKYRNI